VAFEHHLGYVELSEVEVAAMAAAMEAAPLFIPDAVDVPLPRPNRLSTTQLWACGLYPCDPNVRAKMRNMVLEKHRETYVQHLERARPKSLREEAKLIWNCLGVEERLQVLKRDFHAWKEARREELDAADGVDGAHGEA
jgi:hypothetical protein